jgi:hypothetical protein
MPVNQTNLDFYNSLFSKIDFTGSTKPINMDKDLVKGVAK